jgi:hypothetical protein
MCNVKSSKEGTMLKRKNIIKESKTKALVATKDNALARMLFMAYHGLILAASLLIFMDS